MQIYNTLTRKKEKFIPIFLQDLSFANHEFVLNCSDKSCPEEDNSKKKENKDNKKEDNKYFVHSVANNKKPIVKTYTCGITPYMTSHLGHLLTAFRSSFILKHLAFLGYDVVSVQNITDIDDKIINKSRETGIPPLELADFYSKEYNQICEEVGIRLPSLQPKVSDYIQQIISYIQDLIDNNKAYITNSGDVYFDVSQDINYGCLSNQKVAETKEGVRIKVNQEKKNALDFALWKATSSQNINEDTLLKETFVSPWGRGRPGWHIECSVMSTNLLGEEFDLHLGGQDLLFPHHENEIAQCRAHSGKNFVRYWLHLGLFYLNGSKMSKSTGNFLDAKEGLDKYGRTLLFFSALRTHYRSHLNFSEKLFDEILNQVCFLYKSLNDLELFFQNYYSLNLDNVTISSGSCVPLFTSEELINLESQFSKQQDFLNSLGAATKKLFVDYMNSMNDDFNTPCALVAIMESLKSAQKLLQKIKKLNFEDKATFENKDNVSLINELNTLYRFIKTFCYNLGLEYRNYEEVFKECLKFRSNCVGLEQLELEQLNLWYEERQKARAKKDYIIADTYRDLALPYSITFLDGNEQKWRFDNFIEEEENTEDEDLYAIFNGLEFP